MFEIIAFFLRFFKKIYPIFVEKINKRAVEKRHGIYFYTPTKLCQWRGQTLLKKEPDTIKWIDGFHEKDIFWDIGANIGIYSLYAAIKKGVKVYAFEPSPFNFQVMAKNIYLNTVSSNISAFCLALSDKTTIDYLNLKSVNEGAAHTSFKGNQNEFGETFKSEYSHATLGFRADDFLKIFQLPVPNHIKIDVDGSERLVIEGAEGILKNPALKSILIELTADLRAQDQIVFDYILSCGFVLKQKNHPDGDIRLSNYIFNRL